MLNKLVTAVNEIDKATSPLANLVNTFEVTPPGAAAIIIKPMAIAVGKSNIAVIVEDIASACLIARLEDYTGFAILGTQFTNTLNKSLHGYKSVYILLDADATRKAALINKKLRGSFLRTTSKDPKELGLDQLLSIIKNKTRI